MTIALHSSHLYVLLSFDGRYLLVPQDDIDAVEIIADAHLTRTTIGAIGWFGHGIESPIFCLDKSLNLLTDIPKSREYFALLKTKQQAIGLTCDEIENINLQHKFLHRQPLPVVMKTDRSPISELIIYQNQLACVCRGTALVRYLTQLSEQVRPDRY